jgi:hypothetical protein
VKIDDVPDDDCRGTGGFSDVVPKLLPQKFLPPTLYIQHIEKIHIM